MKLIATRIRVESSSVTAEYFPEYCLKEKSFWGKWKETWCGVSTFSSHGFGRARVVVDSRKESKRYTLKWAQAVIDLALMYNEEDRLLGVHKETKETTYVKYP